VLPPGQELVFCIQGDSGGNAAILESDSVGHCMIK